MSRTKAAIAGITSVLILAGLVLGGWQAGWWFTAQNVNRRAHVYRQSFEAQQTLRDEITRKLGDYQGLQADALRNPGYPGLTQQAHAVLDIICKDADQVRGDGLPADQQDFVTTHCLYGSAR